MATRTANQIFSAVHGVAVTPSDATDLAATGDPFRALYVGGAGNVVIVDLSGQTVTFNTVPAGTVLPVQGSKVKAATTATSIVALY